MGWLSVRFECLSDRPAMRNDQSRTTASHGINQIHLVSNQKKADDAEKTGNEIGLLDKVSLDGLAQSFQYESADRSRTEC